MSIPLGNRKRKLAMPGFPGAYVPHAIRSAVYLLWRSFLDEYNTGPDVVQPIQQPNLAKSKYHVHQILFAVVR